MEVKLTTARGGSILGGQGSPLQGGLAAVWDVGGAVEGVIFQRAACP